MNLFCIELSWFQRKWKNHRSPTAPAGTAGSATRVVNSHREGVHEVPLDDDDDHAKPNEAYVGKLVR